MRALLSNLALLVTTLVVLLLAAEGTFRLLARPAPQGPALVLAPELAGLPEFHGSFALATPNTRGIFKGTFFRTNSFGIRGPEYAMPKPDGVFRIVVIGDSFTMGSGVREEEAYPALLETMLNDTKPGRRYEVINLGLGGLNLKGSVTRLEQIGLRYQPDMIAYGWTYNDIEGPSYRETGVDGWWNPGHDSASYLMRWIQPRWQSIRDTFLPGPGSYVYELDENYFRNPAAWDDFTADLGRLADDIHREHTCGAVLVHTGLHSLNGFHPFLRHYEAIERAATERRLTTIQSFPSYEGMNARSLWVSAVDSHPNAAGHVVLARVLMAGLNGLPPRCWLAKVPSTGVPGGPKRRPLRRWPNPEKG
jgi:hypothetical protein